MAETSTASPASGKAIRRLVIVESPTKARKIAGYLGPNYVVESSRGHIRDLPRGAADVPARYKGEKWARLGVNVDDNFEPLYVVSPDKKSTVTELKSLLKDVDELYLATVVAGTYAVSRISFWFDRTIVDGIVNGAGAATRFSSWVSGLVDKHGVDGVVNGVGNTLHDASFGFRRAHTGLVQNYALAMVLGVVVFVGVYLVVR